MPQIKNPKRRLTKFEKELLKIIDGLVFYGEHRAMCNKNYYHNPNLKCSCSAGAYLVDANIILNEFNMGFHQHEVDKEWIELNDE